MGPGAAAKRFRRAGRNWSARTADDFYEEVRKPGKTQYTPAYYRRLRKRIAGWVLVTFGVVVGGSHIVTHLGYFQVLPRAGLQDLLMGYPMAGVLVVAGIVLLSS